MAGKKRGKPRSGVARDEGAEKDGLRAGKRAEEAEEREGSAHGGFGGCIRV